MEPHADSRMVHGKLWIECRHEAPHTGFAEGQYAKAFRLIKQSAERGEVKGLFILSTLYRLGLGVEADEYEGVNWCKMAAEEGHLEAQFQLGLMYLESSVDRSVLC